MITEITQHLYSFVRFTSCRALTQFSLSKFSTLGDLIIIEKKIYMNSIYVIYLDLNYVLDTHIYIIII